MEDSSSSEYIMKEKLKLNYSDESHLSEVSPTELISNGDTSSSCDNYLNDHRTIFLCGYVQDRWHNESLNNITNDLSSDYFVCTNKTKDNFNFTLTRDMLKNTKTFVFLLNEYTLHDLACLLCLQYAYEIHLPIIVLRPPQTQLIILNKNMADNTKEQLSDDEEEEVIKKRIDSLKLDHKIDIKIITKLLYDGYEKSIPYDRLEHSLSMKKLKKQLKSSVPITARRMSTRKLGVIESQHHITLIRQHRKLKNISRNKIDKEEQKNLSTDNYLLIPQKRNPSKVRNIDKKKSNKRNFKESSSLVNLPKYIENFDIKGEQSNYSSSQIGKNFHLPDINLRRRASDFATEDREGRDLFKTTRYLIFNGKDPSRKPQLVNFPKDLYDEDGELIDSEIYQELTNSSNIYGNEDSDFDADKDFENDEEKQKIALIVKGNLKDDDLYNDDDDDF
uniref:Protein LTV1 homolog n=1 Tax=Parastrongyloides trichosuri TaxID=131310 RepID=A0A0N5A548_PARTI